MINVNELRRGNFVFINNLKNWPEMQNIPMQVNGFEVLYRPGNIWQNSIKIKKVNPKFTDVNIDFNQLDKYIEPIEITEKWLIDLGFEKVYESDVSMQFEIAITANKFLCFKVNIINNINKSITVKYNDDFLRYLKYIHELQNLIFAISGIELQLKKED